MVRASKTITLARRAISALALAGLLLALCSGPALAATFTVKNTKSGGPGSLRSAIHKANATPKEDAIEFDVPGNLNSILPTSPLPAITSPVTIDGYTQPGATENTSAEGNNAVLKIRMNGANAGRRANGLVIRAADTTVRGLVINRFMRNGILLKGATGSSIEGNYIGTDQTGTLDHANGRAGVRIVDGAGNTVGGTGLAQRNLISWNRGGGVRVEGASAGNGILSNLIFRNPGIGIDLGADGVTPNDPDDPDAGPNTLQNFPEIASAVRSGNTTTISGTLQSTPGQTFTIQCFGTEAGGDPSDHGEGRTLLDQDLDVTTDANGDAAFTCSSEVPAVGDRVSATATNATTGDTSEFSENETVQ
jgi:hypothetical protein